jgi:iron complex outermembrane recepter protein
MYGGTSKGVDFPEFGPGRVYQPRVTGLVVGLLSLLAWTRVPADEAPILANLSLEQLSQIEITTISRRSASLADTPAAVTVLSGQDILRSGAKSVAEALRQVPGLMVGQIDANSWAISSRGFNSEFATKMLVMMDGRSVYSPLFSGTFWDVQNVMLEDLEKIEVVRGPGSTLWGANAVNGVINIVTRSARDTQGALVYGGGGFPQQALAGVRYGGQAGPQTYYRVYSLYQQSDAFPRLTSGNNGADRWNLGQGGFRLDHETAGGARVTWQGDGYHEQVPEGTESTHGANTLGRYRQDLSDTSSIELQAYFDYTYRRTFLFETPRYMADLDFQHSFALGERHAFLWGLGYRLNYSEYAATSPLLTVNQDTLTAHLFSGFVEDEIQVVPDKVTVTPGCKIEHNDMTGWEPQPGVRLAVRPKEGQLIWASVSRAVRIPGDGEYHGVLTYPVFTASGPGIYSSDRNVQSEKLVAYEAGCRFQILKNLSADLATYYNDYDGVIAQAPSGQFVAPGVPRVTSQNMLFGGVYGGELALTYRPLEIWRLTAWYGLSFADLDAPSAVLTEVRRTESRVPAHQAFLRSSLDITHRWQFDAQLRYVDNVETSPAYVEADVRLAWRPTNRLELAVVGQNLLHESHREFRQATSAAHAAVPRGVYAKLTWRY